MGVVELLLAGPCRTAPCWRLLRALINHPRGDWLPIASRVGLSWTSLKTLRPLPLVGEWALFHLVMYLGVYGAESAGFRRCLLTKLKQYVNIKE